MTAGRVPRDFAPSLGATSYRGSDATPIANGTNVAEVEVDVETGAVAILRYSVAHDCGVLGNPALVDGQIVGGVVHGVSNTLYEHVVHLETPSPLNPIGVKEAGEGGTIPATPALIATIKNTLEPFDVALDCYSVTPEALVAAIGASPASRTLRGPRSARVRD